MAKEISKAKILICDDSMMIRKKMKALLSDYGITELYEATNGREAVEKFVEVTPDITFMDIVMPEMTGVEALKMIKTSAPDGNVDRYRGQSL